MTTRPQPERKTYDAREAAALLGVSVGTIYREVRAGRIPGIQTGPKGARILVLKAPLDALLAGESVAS